MPINRLQLEQEFLFTKSKAQMINLYLDLLEEKDKQVNELYNLSCMLDSEIMKQNYLKANHINFEIRDKLKELKENSNGNK